ncbi:peptide ABC transporter substrate-binding protein [Virgibacillus salarius]
MKKWSLLVAFGIVLSVFLAACGGDDNSTEGLKSKDSGTSESSGDNTLNLLQSGTISTMDSSMATDEFSFQFLGSTMEGLYRLDKNGEPTEGIAKEHKVSDDGLTWTFTLREDAKWENGDPVTANDFVYAWQRAVNPETGSEYGPYMMSGVIKNAEAVSSGDAAVDELGVTAKDDYTLVVELENPTPYFESLTTFGTFLPLNEKFVEEQGDKYATSSETVLSNGPFVLKNWTSTSSSWDLEKNESYWDADTVQLDKLTYEVVKDPQTAVDLYEKGTVDRADLSSDLVDQYATHEDYNVSPEMSVWYLKFNETRNEALANTNIRAALSRAFDKQSLVDVILNNGSVVANGLIPENFVQMPEGEKDFREVSGDHITYDPEAAKEYWKKGLKELGKDSIELEFLSGDTETAKTMNEYLVNQLESNLDGLKINLKQVPGEQRLDLDTKMDYDIQLSGWGPDYLDPYTYMSLWVTEGGNNKMGYSNKEYDKLVEETTTELATNNTARYENFLEAEKILFEDAAIAPVYQRAKAQLVSPKMHGVYMNAFGPTYEYKWASVE